MSTIANMSVFPVGDSEHLSGHVADALRVIRTSGVEHRLGPMGTILEGDLADILAVAEACVKELEKTCPRVYMTLALDHRPGRESGMDGKVRSVEQALKNKP